MVFVTFNKVITAQYFIWYISLIPLIAPYNKLFDYNRHGGKVIYGLFLYYINHNHVIVLKIILDMC